VAIGLGGNFLVGLDREEVMELCLFFLSGSVKKNYVGGIEWGVEHRLVVGGSGGSSKDVVGRGEGGGGPPPW